jgi:hypothetical protein
VTQSVTNLVYDVSLESGRCGVVTTVFKQDRPTQSVERRSGKPNQDLLFITVGTSETLSQFRKMLKFPRVAIRTIQPLAAGYNTYMKAAEKLDFHLFT